MRSVEESVRASAERERWILDRAEKYMRERGPMKVLSPEYFACREQAERDYEAEVKDAAVEKLA